MLERYCDALIVGTEIPGLITAAFLARRGLSVHIIDPYSHDDDQQLDPYCIAHLHSKLLRSILGRLNVPENDIQYLTSQDSPLQVIFPRQRIDISTNPAIFYEELKREFPKEYENLKVFYENLAHLKHRVDTNQLYELLPPTNFREQRQLVKFIASQGLNQQLNELSLAKVKNPILQSFIQAQLKILTYSQPMQPFAFQVAELLNPSDGEVLSLKNGHHFIRKLFLDRVEHHEGSIKTKTKIEELLYRNGIFEGVKMSGSEGNILARYIIWNTELTRLTDYLPKLWRFRKLKKSIENIKPAYHWFTARYAVPHKFLPTPLKENIVMIEDPGSELISNNFLYLQINKDDPKYATIAVNYLLEASHLKENFDFFQKIHQEILKALQFLFPFADTNIRQIFPLLKAHKNEGTLFPLKENDFETFKHTAIKHPIYTQEANTFADLFAISFKTPAPNFLITSQEILGSMGYESKYMLGLKVTDLIWRDVEKEKKRAMKVDRRIA